MVGTATLNRRAGPLKGMGMRGGRKGRGAGIFHEAKDLQGRFEGTEN